jgi:uncharacterized protein YhdP
VKVHLIKGLRNLLYIFAVFTILFLLLFALTRLFTPLLNQQHTRVEAWLSQTLNHPVRLASVSVRWNIFSPIVDFTDVVILNDARTHSLLKVDRLNVFVDVWDSLLELQITPQKLFISGAQLVLRQDDKKKWSFDGMRGLMKESSAADQEQALIELEEWLLSERNISLHNISIKTHFLNGQTSALFVEQLNLLFIPKENSLQVDKGRLQFQGRNIRLNDRELFRQEVLLNDLNGKLGWENREGKWSFEVSQIQAQNKDLNFSGALTLQNSADDTGIIINLVTDFNIEQVKNKSLYLPIAVLKPDLVDWLDKAVVDAKRATGKIILRGNLRDFPFDKHLSDKPSSIPDSPRQDEKGFYRKQKNQGEFFVETKIAGLTLAYEPGWPVIRGLDTHLLFSGSRMEITGNAGKILNGQIQQVKAVIPDLEADISMLYISGAIAADSADALAFIRQSPLDKTLGAELRNIRLRGPLQLGLGLTIPLDGPLPMELAGTAVLTNNQLILSALNLTATQLEGKLAFTKKTIDVPAMTGQFLEQPIRFDLKKEQQSDMVRASIVGKLATRSLPQDKKFSWIRERIPEGKIDYNAKLSLAMHDSNKNSSIVISSNLQGLKIDLPTPFGKTARGIKPLQIELSLDFKQFLSMRINYGKQLQASLSYKINDKQGFQLTKGIFDLQSNEMAGQIESPVQPGMPWRATFKYLHLPAMPDDKNNKLSRITPQDIPAFALQVADFQYAQKQLGHLKLRLAPAKRGLEIRTLVLTSPDFTLTANGAWEGVGKRAVTRLSGHAISNNLEATLKRWNIPAGISGKNTNLAFNLRWPNSPLDFEFKKVEGVANLQIKNGQIIDIGSNAAAKMGFGRLLNALSLETIRRRLMLDFSDLTHSGFSFDVLQGQFKLANGNAVTEDVQVVGPVARIDIQGRIGVSAKDYDLNLTVTPNLTGNLPVLAAFFGGPVIGLAVLAANKLLGSTVGKMTARRYQMQGNWSQPTVSLIGTAPVPANSNSN